MYEDRHYLDLLKAHKVYRENEGRWKFYDAYIKNRDLKAWFKSDNVSLKEGLLLFGWVHSWDPNFQGDLTKFLKIYRDIFPMLRKFKNNTLIKISLTDKVKNSLSLIFDKIAKCPREKRFESTDTSKILHALIPGLFVMWDDSIRKAIIGNNKHKKGRDYVYNFLLKMQEAAKEYLRNYIKKKGGSLEFASQHVSKMANNYTLAKLIDEYNYVRYKKRKSLLEIRNTLL